MGCRSSETISVGRVGLMLKTTLVSRENSKIDGGVEVRKARAS